MDFCLSNKNISNASSTTLLKIILCFVLFVNSRSSLGEKL